MNQELENKRANLKRESYSDAFPGSLDWKAARAAEKELAEFDAAHPEIVAEIKSKEAKKKEADKKDTAQLGWI